MLHCTTDRFHQEYPGKRRTRWLAFIPPGHTIDDVKSPEYFGQIRSVQKLETMDIIEVIADDASWYGELMVRALPQSIALVFTSVRFIHVEPKQELPVGWDVEYRGQSDRYVILRAGHLVEKGYSTPEEAAIQANYLAAPKGAQVGSPVAADVAPKNKGGRPPKPKPEADPVEADAVT